MGNAPEPRHSSTAVPEPQAATVFIHICRNNPVARRADLLSGPGRRVESTECLDECTVCERRPFAYVQGELVKAMTVDALAVKVTARVARLKSCRHR